MFASKIKKVIYSFFVLKIQPKGDRRNYYELSIERESLRASQQLIKIRTEDIFETETEILFRDIHLSKNLKSFIGDLGTPNFKFTTKYFHSNHNVLIYKKTFCGYNSKIVINTLNDKVLNCAYHIKIDDTIKLGQIKLAIKNKYQIENTDSDNFLIIDKAGNKILFKFQFDLTITYINTSSDIQRIIENVFEDEIHLKEIYKQKQLETLISAF